MNVQSNFKKDHIFKEVSQHSEKIADFFYGTSEPTGYYEGLPYFGDPAYLATVRSTDAIPPVVTYKSHIQVFSLNVPEDVTKLERIWDMAVTGLVHIDTEDKVYDKDIGTWKVFVKWIDKFVVKPT